MRSIPIQLSRNQFADNLTATVVQRIDVIGWFHKLLLVNNLANNRDEVFGRMTRFSVVLATSIARRWLIL